MFEKTLFSWRIPCSTLFAWIKTKQMQRTSIWTAHKANLSLEKWFYLMVIFFTGQIKKAGFISTLCLLYSRHLKILLWHNLFTCIQLLSIYFILKWEWVYDWKLILELLRNKLFAFTFNLPMKMILRGLLCNAKDPIIITWHLK